MSIETAPTFPRFSELSPALAVKILSFTPVSTYASVSKAFRTLQEKLMEQIWIAMKSNPLLAKRISTLPSSDFSPLSLKLLFDKQRALCERTIAGFNAFHALPNKNSYAQARFERAEPIISEVDDEQDVNLMIAWLGNGGPLTLRTQLTPFLGGENPQSADEIRAWMNRPANQRHLNRIRTLNFDNLRLTAFPPELVKCRFLQVIYGRTNLIRELPDWFEQFTWLKEIYVRENYIDRIPDFLLRMPKLQLIGMRANPIRTLSERHHHHFYTGGAWWRFGFFDNQLLYLSPSQLTEMPFSLYLEKPCYAFESFLRENYADFAGKHKELYTAISHVDLRPIWTSIFGNSALSRILCSLVIICFKLTNALCNLIFALLCMCSVAFIQCCIWLIMRPYLWAIIPAATWIREQLGYGRMISLR